MTPCLYLHIGLPKTGTTAIQKFLAGNRDVLREKGFSYPDITDYCENNGICLGEIGNQSQNGVFFEKYLEKNKLEIPMEDMLKDDDFLNIHSFISDELENAGRVILSNENLGIHDITDYISYIQELGYRVKILVYIRRQDELLESLWKQDIENGFFEGVFTEYLRVRKDSNIVGTLHYEKLLSRLETVVERENIYVHDYDAEYFKTSPDLICKDFLDMLMIGGKEEFTYPDILVNTSIEKKILFKSEIFKKIMKEFEKDNEWMKENYTRN